MLLVGCELAHFLFQLVELLLEPRRLEHEHVGRFLPVRRIELERYRATLSSSCCALAIDLPSCKIAISIIDCFANLLPSIATLAFASRPHLATEIDEARAYPADRRAIVLAEIGNHLVIGNQPSE